MNEPYGGDTAVGSPGAPALLNAKVHGGQGEVLFLA